MTRRYGKHNIIGSEAHRPRPIAYVRQGFLSRRSPRPQPVVLLIIGVAGLIAALLPRWLLG
jgi:hypothetical protein